MNSKSYKIFFKTIYKSKIQKNINFEVLEAIYLSNKACVCKNDFKYVIGYKDAKKFYGYSFQKLVHIEETLIKLNVCLFDKL